MRKNTKETNAKQLEIMCKNLKFLRESRGWSIEYLSETSGINKKILAQIEAGQDFDVRHLIKLSGIYTIKPHELFSYWLNQSIPTAICDDSRGCIPCNP